MSDTSSFAISNNTGVSEDYPSSSKRPTVAAVIVTYNRKTLLLECVDALLAQSTHVDKIVIIDNASTDGTSDALRENGRLPHEVVDYVKLTSNTGSAGGFNAGIKRAYDCGYDWLWLMDDDGRPDVDALSNLLEASKGLPIVGPLILAKEDNSGQRLAFPIGIAKKKYIHTRAEAKEQARNGLIRDWVNYFNGVLISRDVVHAIGFPVQDLFIWGDEIEYRMRALKAGYNMATAVHAVFYHPANKMMGLQGRVLNIEYSISHADTRLKNYFIIRNLGYITRRYNGILGWLKHTAKYFYHYCIHRGMVSPLDVLTYSIEGFKGDLRGHKTFL